MRTRFALVSIVALVLAACTIPSERSDNVPLPGDLVSGEFLLVNSSTGIGVIDASTGALRVEIDDAYATPNWSDLYRASSTGKGTAVETIEPATGRVISRTTVRGDLEISVVSSDGSVALMPATPKEGWEARSVTRLTILDPSGELQRFSLRGNYEPEAFSTDGDRLFMLRYQPALSPESYRVTSLRLLTGHVLPVYGPEKSSGVVENMAATRVHQAMSPSEDVLFTLYTNQPPEFLKGAAVDAEHSRAFIHTLNLEYGTAICISLPKSFGTVSPGASALAASPDGRYVYAVDIRHGTIATLRTRNSKVSEHSVDLAALGGGPISASVSTDGEVLYIAGSAGVISLGTDAFAQQPVVPTPGSVTGLAFSPDGERLFASWAGGIGLLDPVSLETVEVLPSPAPSGAVAFVGTA